MELYSCSITGVKLPLKSYHMTDKASGSASKDYPKAVLNQKQTDHDVLE